MAVGTGDNRTGAGTPGGRTPPAPPRSVPKPPSAPQPAFAGLRVSLMPSETEGGKAPDLRTRLLIMILALVVETIVVGGVNFYLAQDASKKKAEAVDLAKQAAVVSKQASDLQKQLGDALLFDRQVSAVKDGLNSHVYWTKMFGILEKDAQPNVIFQNLNGDVDGGVVTLDALGKAYEDVAEQIVAFQNDPLVSQLRTSAVSVRQAAGGGTAGVHLTLFVKFKPEAWQKTAAAPAK